MTNFDSLSPTEQKEYKKQVRGLFARVTYAGDYVVGMIEDFVVEK